MDHILCLHLLQVVWICLLVRIPPHTDRILQIEIPDSALRISRVPRRILSLHHLLSKLHRLTFCAIIEIRPADAHARRACMYKQHTSIRAASQTHPDMPFHTAYITRSVVSLHQIAPATCRTGACHLRRTNHIAGFAISGMKYIIQQPADITGTVQAIMTLISRLIKSYCSVCHAAYSAHRFDTPSVTASIPAPASS